MSPKAPKASAIEATASKAVIVTTEHRGVFFGYLPAGQEPTKEKVTIANARNCISWDASVRGFVGLAATGPNDLCRVGPAAPSLTLFDIASVLTCSPEAVIAWEAGKWQQ